MLPPKSKAMNSLTAIRADITTLMRSRCHPMIATHDPVMLTAASTAAQLAGRGPLDWEAQMLYGIGFNGMMFYSQPFLQRFLGFSPPEAGLVMLPPALTIMVLTPVAFLLATKIGPRPAIGAGMALMGVGMVLFSTLEIGDGYADLMPGVLLVGVGAALAMPLVMYVLKAVPEKRAGVASGVRLVESESWNIGGRVSGSGTGEPSARTVPDFADRRQVFEFAQRLERLFGRVALEQLLDSGMVALGVSGRAAGAFEPAFGDAQPRIGGFGGAMQAIAEVRGGHQAPRATRLGCWGDIVGKRGDAVAQRLFAIELLLRARFVGADEV